MMVLTAMYAGLSLSVGRLLACNSTKICAYTICLCFLMVKCNGIPSRCKSGKKFGEDLKWKASVAPDGIFLPRRARARCRWRKTTDQGDLATPTCILLRGGGRRGHGSRIPEHGPR
uniref:Uncharacterized protein n=1 Tax=Zea mays TaxID=4577 RepID=C4JBP7_MAIZE|nr:unknown [Zea mays]